MEDIERWFWPLEGVLFGRQVAVTKTAGAGRFLRGLPARVSRWQPPCQWTGQRRRTLLLSRPARVSLLEGATSRALNGWSTYKLAEQPGMTLELVQPQPFCCRLGRWYNARGPPPPCPGEGWLHTRSVQARPDTRFQ